MNAVLTTLTQSLFQALLDKGKVLVTAESCTGGLVAASLTEIAGSSAVFDRGFVTYSNQSKVDMLGVNPETLAKFGAVSEQTAFEMARGALEHTPAATVSISITGIAGPSGGTADKPVGLVCFGFGRRGEYKNGQNGDICVISEQQHFLGERTEVRNQAALYAIQRVLDFI